MADEQSNFPTMPARHWWTLRDRLKRSVPPVVTPQYLESALDITERSAKDLIPQLKLLGLMDDENKPTSRAEDWRHDDTYAQACAEIRDALYPEELQHAVPDPTNNRSSAERWFARRKKVGENVAKKMAVVYQLVTEADLDKAADTARSSPKAKSTERSRQRAVRSKDEAAAADEGNASGAVGATAGPLHSATGLAAPPPAIGPSLHIDIQIHISSDASASQIDQIFASMAKHLYRRGVEEHA
jgi:hypothetical protein